MIRKLWITLALLGVAILVAAFLVISAPRPYHWHGSVFQAAAPAAAFQLSDSVNSRFDLNQQKGKVVLLFFGYTHCPDECPLTMAKLKQVKLDLGKQANQVEVVFITIDPKRDSSSVLQAYLAKFDPSFIGLTGSPSELATVWKDYGVDVQISGDNSLQGYLVPHSTELYVIDQQGRLRLTYGTDNSAADIESDLRYLLVQG